MMCRRDLCGAAFDEIAAHVGAPSAQRIRLQSTWTRSGVGFVSRKEKWGGDGEATPPLTEATP